MPHELEQTQAGTANPLVERAQTNPEPDLATEALPDLKKKRLVEILRDREQPLLATPDAHGPG